MYRGLIIDLDYVLDTSAQFQIPEQSILSFLEERVQSQERLAILIHGAFGCGKTTTAKQFVAHLCQDYLRGHYPLPKVLYINVNNIDIRSRREECIESQLSQYRLPRTHVDCLIAQVQADEIHLIFDGVDEMAEIAVWLLRR